MPEKDTGNGIPKKPYTSETSDPEEIFHIAKLLSAKLGNQNCLIIWLGSAVVIQNQTKETYQTSGENPHYLSFNALIVGCRWWLC